MEQSSDLLPLLICGGFCLFPILLFGGTYYLFRRRIGKLEEKARSLGFSFDSTGFKFDTVDDPVFREHLPPFDLFSHGKKRKVRNLMRGARDGVDVMVFDYRYKPPMSGNRNVWVQTVIFLRKEGLALPAFDIRPRNLLDRLGVVNGDQVTIDAAPDFSKKYVLQGADPQRAAALFGPAVRAHFEVHAGTSSAGEGDSLIYYRSLDQKSAGQIEPFLTEALELVYLLDGRT